MEGGGGVFFRVLRNVLSILMGLIMYFIMEYLISILFLFLLKIPVLSLLMTGYIPSDVFLNASVATGAACATFYTVKLISDYRAINYSVIVVFATLLIIYIVTLVYRLPTIGFDFVKLTTALIYIGTYLFGCFMSREDI